MNAANIALLMLGAVLAACTREGIQPSPRPVPEPPVLNLGLPHVFDQLIVNFDATQMDRALEELRKQGEGLGLRIENRFQSSPSVLVAFRDDPNQTLVGADALDRRLAATGKRLRQIQGITSVEVNLLFEPFGGDPKLPAQWGMTNVQAAAAWQLETGKPQVRVAVIDDGVDMNHEDLRDNVWLNPCEDLNGNHVIDPLERNGIDDACPGEVGNGYADDFHGWNMVTNTGDAQSISSEFHGTHCAGTIGAVANNDKGIRGLNWAVSIVPIKIMDPTLRARASDVIRAIEYAVAAHADVINASWGVSEPVGSGASGSSTPPPSVAAAVAYAGQHNVVVVAAAGNDGRNIDYNPVYPASLALPNVIAVAAVNYKGVLWNRSNYGSSAVAVAAPGVDVLSTAFSNDYTTATGTSMAAPFVAGAAALLRAHFPGIQMAELRARLMNGDQRPSLAGYVASGRSLNVDRALSIQP